MMSKYKSKGIVVGLSVITMCVLLALIGSRFSFLFQQQSNSATKTVGNSTSKTAIMATPTPTSTAFSTPQPLFFINSVVDTDYTTGQLALFVQNSNLSGGVKASFSSVAVYPAPQQLPSN